MGDATGELGSFTVYRSSWHNNSSIFLDPIYPWLRCGGAFNDGVGTSGVFVCDGSEDNSSSSGFRIVLINI